MTRIRYTLMTEQAGGDYVEFRWFGGGGKVNPEFLDRAEREFLPAVRAV